MVSNSSSFEVELYNFDHLPNFNKLWLRWIHGERFTVYAQLNGCHWYPKWRYHWRCNQRCCLWCYHGIFFCCCLLSVCQQLSGNGLVSFYLAKVLNSIGINSTDQQLVFNGGLMIHNYVVCIVNNLLVFQNFRRRPVFIFTIASMLVVYVIWTVLSRNFEDKALGKGVMGMIFLYYMSYNSGFNGLPYLYLTEILLFAIRAKGINLSLLIQQIILV